MSIVNIPKTKINVILSSALKKTLHMVHFYILSNNLVSPTTFFLKYICNCLIIYKYVGSLSSLLPPIQKFHVP